MRAAAGVFPHGKASFQRSIRTCLALLLPCAAWLAPTAAGQQSRGAGPLGKVYFAEVNGDVDVGARGMIKDAAKSSLFLADGAEIRTSRASTEVTQVYSTMVYSNGSAAYVDADTRLEIRRFAQEPFKPNRTDIDVEPSVSHTDAVLHHGTVALSTSKPVAGSLMSYETPFGTIVVLGREVVIQTDDKETKVTVFDGQCTIKAGRFDAGGHRVESGQQAVLRPGAPGRANNVEVRPIPKGEFGALASYVALASAARRTVYFETRATKLAVVGDVAPRMSTFDDANLTDNPAPATASASEVVAVKLVPAALPVQFTVSPAQLVTRD